MQAHDTNGKDAKPGLLQNVSLSESHDFFPGKRKIKIKPGHKRANRSPFRFTDY